MYEPRVEEPNQSAFKAEEKGERSLGACTEPGEDERSDGKDGEEGAGAGQMVCDRRPRLPMEGGIVEDVQGVAARAAVRKRVSCGDIDELEAATVRCVGEWMVEDVERLVRRDGELERRAGGVEHRHGEVVVVRAPEEEDLDAARRAVCKLSAESGGVGLGHRANLLRASIS